ncbi:MAG: glycosyltransferase family 4 protein [Actinomycetota bacterium]
MRILLACPYAWDVPGGVQVHVRTLAGALEGRGHDVLVVAPSRSGAAAPPPVRIVGRAVGVPYGGTVAPICFSRRSFRAIRRLTEVFEPDVVHVHEPLTPSTSMLATFAATAPVVATFHAFAERSRLMELTAPVLRTVHRRIAASVAVSEAAAEFLARAVPGDVEIVPNGVAVDRFARPGPPAAGLPEGRLVLWTHRLDRQKGFPVAVRAFARLAAELDDVHLVVAGDGRDRDAVGLLSERDRARVVMLGAVPNDDLPPYHAAADAFVAPATDMESFGIVLVEAMAAGVPLVASDIPGYREVVRDGVDGLLVPPNDPNALAAALKRVLLEPDLAASLSRAGRARALEFSWDAVAPRLEAIYDRVAGSSH